MRQRLLFDFDWKFHPGDIPLPELKTHLETYSVVKAGHIQGPAAPTYDDSLWQDIRLPHDWMISQPFDPAASVANGYLPRGMAWYRRSFFLDESDRLRKISIEFDGVFRHSSVWLNGHYLGHHESGYTGFGFPISDVANYGDIPNVLAVRVDASEPEGWWYEGGGIYRHAWLVKTAPVHVAKWGVFAKPIKQPDGCWKIDIETTIENESQAAIRVEIRHALKTPEGADTTASHSDRVDVPAKTMIRHTAELLVSNPQLWSLETPQLYSLHTSLSQNEKTIDEVETSTGLREITCSPDKGLILNGKTVKLQGTCNHQDHAGVGTALPDTLQAWRLRRLKEAGCNAYRCSHHPPTPELLDLCDREGILVIDENRYLSSNPGSLEDLESMVRRDRNHPSIFLWSICNEEYLQGTSAGGRIAETLVARIHQFDPTRPTACALLSTNFRNGVTDAVDVIGINYSVPSWDLLHARHPEKMIVATECTAAVSTRGIYEENTEAAYCDAYDRLFCPGGTTIRETWREILKRPYFAGGFVWSGFDYRGEPGPYGWPAIGVQLGFLDTCGFAKDGFYLYQAFWTTEPMVHLLPHWNWSGREGKPIRVVAYSNAEAIELFLNNRSLGRQSVPPDHSVEWQVPYEPGELRAAALQGDSVVASQSIVTAEAPATLRLTSHVETLQADSEDVAIVTVEVVDNQNRFVPTANPLVRFEIEGPGEIRGIGNGNPTSHESDLAHERKTFNGLCQVIVQSTGKPGTIRLKASSEGLREAVLAIPARPSNPRPSVPSPRFLQCVAGWQKSSYFDSQPDPQDKTTYAAATWIDILPHWAFPNFFDKDQWVAYHANLHVPAGAQNWILAFDRILGSGVVCLNGRPVKKFDADIESLSIELEESQTNQSLSIDLLLFRTHGGAGLYGPVWLWSK